jgi:hypothetical protein
MKKTKIDLAIEQERTKRAKLVVQFFNNHLPKIVLSVLTLFITIFGLIAFWVNFT